MDEQRFTQTLKLDELIDSEIENISGLESGTKEKSAAIDDFTKLYRLRIDEKKVDLDYKDRCRTRENEEVQAGHDIDQRKDQLEEQRLDRYFRLGIAVGELILPLIFYGVWMKRGFKFEEKGVYTSTTFRNLFNRFKPTKK